MFPPPLAVSGVIFFFWRNDRPCISKRTGLVLANLLALLRKELGRTDSPEKYPMMRVICILDARRRTIFFSRMDPLPPPGVEQLPLIKGGKSHDT